MSATGDTVIDPKNFLDQCLDAYRKGTLKITDPEEEAYLLLYEAEKELKCSTQCCGQS